MRELKKHVLGGLGLLLIATAQGQTLSRIQGGTLTVGYRENAMPFSYNVPGQREPIGLSIDLCRAVAQGLKQEFKLSSLNVRFVPVAANDAEKAVNSGKIDLECATSTDTRARRENVNFSHHIFFAGVQLMTRINAGIKDWPDITKRTVSFTQGTTAKAVMSQHKLTKGVAYKTIDAKDHAESFTHLNSGKADAWALENVLLVGIRAQDRNPRAWEIVGEPLSVEPYALMIRKGDGDFQRAVNKELSRIFVTGEYQKIYERWFQSPIPPRNVNLKLEPGLLLRAQMRNPKSAIAD